MNSEKNSLNIGSKIFLIAIVILASLASNALSILVDPWPLLRTFIIAITLASCFYIINYSKIKSIKPPLLAILIAVFAFLIEALIPVADFGLSELFVRADSHFIKLAGYIRVAGYLIVFFVTALASAGMAKVFKTRSEKKRKLMTALPYLAIGPIGGAIFSAVYQNDVIIFTALSGFFFSLLIYVSFFAIILLNNIPHNQVESIETSS